MKKKIFVAMLTALMLCACVISFVACGKEGEEEISDFERYRTDKFIETYTYLRTETDIWSDTYWQDQETHPVLEDLYELKHYTGENQKIYAVQKFVELLGDKIVVSLSETNFTGTLGKMSSELIPRYSFAADLKLNPSEEQAEMMSFINKNNIRVDYYGPSQLHPKQNHVSTGFVFIQEIDGRKYRFELRYSGYCTALAEYV